MLLGYKTTVFGEVVPFIDSAYVKFTLIDGTKFKISQPTFGSVLGLRSTSTTWLPEVQDVFPSSNASKLQQIVINDTEITQVRDYGFYSISTLKTVKDKKGTVMSIGSRAFQNCSSLTTASFPACTTIGDYAFYSCKALASIYLLGSSVPSLSYSNAFTGLLTNYSIFVQPSMLATFQTANVWSTISSHIVAYSE